MVVLAVFRLPVLVASLGAVSVTNHAGGVISGTLTSVTNGTFTLSNRTLPLNVLPVAEQRRLRKLAGQDLRTAKERQREKMLAYELKRIDLRLQAGEITEEQAERLRRDVRLSASYRPGTEKPASGDVP